MRNAVLANATDTTKFSRQEFKKYRNVVIEGLEEGKNGILNPKFNFSGDTVTISGKVENSHLFEDNNIPGTKKYPVPSLVDGYSGGLESWEPLDSENSDEQQVWVLCDSVSIPITNKPVKFSMLPLDDGYMVFCLKEGAVRFNILQNGQYREQVLVRGTASAPAEGTLYNTVDSSTLISAINPTWAEYLKNSFLSGTITNNLKVRRVRGSHHIKESESLDISFKPEIRYSALLDGGEAYEAEQKELKKKEEERLAMALREEQVRKEMANKQAQEKKTTTTASRGTAKKAKAQTRARGADDFLAKLGF